MKFKLFNKVTGEEIDASEYSIDSEGVLMHSYDDNTCGDAECCGPNYSVTAPADDSWEGGGVAKNDIEIRYEK